MKKAQEMQKLQQVQQQIQQTQQQIQQVYQYIQQGQQQMQQIVQQLQSLGHMVGGGNAGGMGQMGGFSGLNNMMEKEIKSTFIGELVMEQLKNLDEVAYVRFASVYRQFTDVNTFTKEIEELVGTKKGTLNGKGK